MKYLPNADLAPLKVLYCKYPTLEKSIVGGGPAYVMPIIVLQCT
jgi:hypothetical protein